MLVGFDEVDAELAEGCFARIPEHIGQVVGAGVAVVVVAVVVVRREGVLAGASATLKVHKRHGGPRLLALLLVGADAAAVLLRVLVGALRLAAAGG